MDINGNFTKNGLFEENDNSKYTLGQYGILQRKQWIDEPEEYRLGKDKNIRLYTSNSTWKLEDENGNPIYDERYYECIYRDECYFLVNEDNQMCLIDRNGNKLVDYEYLTYDGKYGYFMGIAFDSDNFFVGDDGVSFVSGNEVYFFGVN